MKEQEKETGKETEKEKTEPPPVPQPGLGMGLALPWLAFPAPRNLLCPCRIARSPAWALGLLSLGAP